MLAGGPDDNVCVTRECTERATVVIAWKNPNLPFGRGKNWKSCSEHLQSLIDYLKYRDFSYEVTNLSDISPD